MNILGSLAPYSKAIAAFLVSGAVALALHFGLQLSGDVQSAIGALVIAVLAGGATYQVKNKPAPPTA